MSTSTPNYGLVKPTEATDFVDVDIINANMDTIDTQMKANADAITAALTPSAWVDLTPYLDLTNMNNTGTLEYRTLLGGHLIEVRGDSIQLKTNQTTNAQGNLTDFSMCTGLPVAACPTTGDATFIMNYSSSTILLCKLTSGGNLNALGGIPSLTYTAGNNLFFNTVFTRT